jgi:hypothetical protein
MLPLLFFRFSTAPWACGFTVRSSKMTALCTSAYVKRDGAWKFALHQQTEVE